MLISISIKAEPTAQEGENRCLLEENVRLEGLFADRKVIPEEKPAAWDKFFKSADAIGIPADHRHVAWPRLVPEAIRFGLA